jgi:quinol monooxygenase YgiN
MPKVAIIGTIEVEPGRREQLLPFLMEHRARCMKDEAAITLLMEFLAPYDDDSKVFLYEVYRDDAAFEVHRNGRSMAQFTRDTAAMRVRLHVTKCALLAGQLA